MSHEEKKYPENVKTIKNISRKKRNIVEYAEKRTR